MDSWVDDEGTWKLPPKSKSKSPVEKMRIRLASEAYDGKYTQMDDDSDDKSLASKGQKKNYDNYSCNRVFSPCILLAAIVLLVLIGFIILAIVLKIRINEISRVCGAPGCYIKSGAMLSKMDTSVNPCKDFYQYSCSAFTSNVNIPPEKLIYSTLRGEMDSTKMARLRQILEAPGSDYKGGQSSAVAKARQFYSACLNVSTAETQGNTPLLDMIKSLGSWTVTGTWDASTWSLESSVANANLYGLYPFFSADVGKDDKNSSVTAIFMDQCGLSFSYQSYIGNSSETFHKAFIDYFVTTADLLGASDDAQVLGEDIWQFEKELAQIFIPPEDRADPLKLYNPMSVGEIQSYFGSAFDVRVYLKKLYGSSIDWSKPIIVNVPNYFRKLGKLMAAANPATMANYIGWRAVYAMGPYMSTAYQIASLQFNMAIYGTPSQPQRWEFCSRVADAALGFATGALYVDKYFSERDRLQVQTIVEMIRHEFKKTLSQNEWMDKKTKATAIDKVQSLLYKVGYPEFVTNVLLLDDYYSQLNVTSSAFQNALNAAVFDKRKNIAKLGKPVDRTLWTMTPATINAYYSPSLNQIVIPAGILQEPLYSSQFPASLNFGSIGFIIGHEITHGFDNHGRQYDKYGNMVDWWGNSSASRFESLSQCFVDQYSSFQVQGYHLNGVSTKGENLADNGGLKLSYQAYQTWLRDHSMQDHLLPGLNMTHEQQFFLGFGQTWCAYYRPQFEIKLVFTDVHSNAKYRVNGAVQNMPEFASAFDCSESAPMNPAKKCTLW